MNLEKVILYSSQIKVDELQQLVFKGEYAAKHLIYVFDESAIHAEDSSLFLAVAKALSNQKLSFVLVSTALTYENVHEGIALCPTLDEAHDLIELEAIQRDLEE
ncbi:MAG: hypothetical protein O2869_04060 [Bacteroidetes bacterium]|nr:hypothetical protein [Bacteroidota bacterium]MDA0950781.1 hypothetical protein [Bacteroidota bacterium]